MPGRIYKYIYMYIYKKEAIQISLRGVESKSTSLGVRRCGADMWMWIIQDGLKVLAREIDIFYVLCFTWGRKMAPVYGAWMRAGAGEGEGTHARGMWGERREVAEKKEEARKIKWNRRAERKQKHGKEDREWLTTGCVESSGTTPERRRSGEKMEGRRDDANGFWTWCIQLSRRAWIKHCPGQSGRTGYGASH